MNSLHLNGQPYPSANITFHIPTKLIDGYLWNKVYPDEIVSSFTLSDIQNNNIYFIPFDAINNTANQVVDVIIKYANHPFYSYNYVLSIKNYVARFNNTVYCLTYKEPPQIYVGDVSAGLLQDGFTWNPSFFTPPNITNNISTFTQTLSLGNKAYDWKLPIYADSHQLFDSVEYITYRIGRTESVSLHKLIVPILYQFNYSAQQSQNLLFYIIKAPSAGILQNIQRKNDVLAYFELSDLESNNIVYQHVGTTNTTDDFTLALSSTPYDMKDASITINLEVYDPPVITSHNIIHTYFPNKAVASNQLNKIYPNLSLSSTLGYVTFFASEGITLANASTSISKLDSLIMSVNDYIQNKARFQLSSNILNTSSYPGLTLYAATTYTDDPTNNNILNHPFYASMFRVPLSVRLNEYISINTLYPGKSDLQNITYRLDNALQSYSNLIGHSFSAVIQVKPYQNMLDNSVVDASVFELENLSLLCHS